jgi:L-lactate permease
VLVRPLLKYSLIRIGIFIVALAILLIVGVNPYISAIVAAVAGFVLSYVFFRKLRMQVAADFAARNEKPEAIRNVDTDAEDEVLDAQDASQAEQAEAETSNPQQPKN